MYMLESFFPMYFIQSSVDSYESVNMWNHSCIILSTYFSIHIHMFETDISLTLYSSCHPTAHHT